MFSGEVKIRINCKEATEYILLHSVDHNISYMSITNSTGTTELVDLWQHKELEMIQIRSKYMLTPGAEYTLTIQSVSSMSESLRGFYYSPYKELGQTRCVPRLIVYTFTNVTLFKLTFYRFFMFRQIRYNKHHLLIWTILRKLSFSFRLNILCPSPIEEEWTLHTYNRILFC